MYLNEAKGHLQKLLRDKTVPFLWGPPGIGKSAIISQICEEWEWDLIDLRLSLLSPVDLRGLPFLNKDKHVAEWLKPDFLPNGGSKEHGILFLDELNTAPTSVQIAAYQLILDKRIGNYIFPEGWRMVAAGNRETDSAAVTRMPSPLANRMIHLELQANIEDWKEWARGKVRPEIIAFLNFRPNLLSITPKAEDRAFPTPRSWNFVSKILDTYGGTDGTDDVVYGTVGEGAGKEFMAFLNSYKYMPDIEGILEGRVKDVPKKPDILYATVSSLVARVKKENFDNLLAYSRLLPPEFMALCIRETAKSGWTDNIRNSKLWKEMSKEIGKYL